MKLYKEMNAFCPWKEYDSINITIIIRVGARRFNVIDKLPVIAFADPLQVSR
jgi:hypothetical protein